MKTFSITIRGLLPVAIAVTLIMLLYAFLILQPESSAQGSTLITTSSVSGFIRHNSNPIEGVEVSISWEGGTQSDTTASDGGYNIGGVPTDTLITILVRPPLALGLAFESFRTTLSGDWVKDFDLVAGYRLQGEVHKPDSSTYTGFSPSIRAIGTLPIEANFESLAMDNSGRIDLYLRPGFYALVSNPEMAPYFLPPAIFDLRSGDLVSQTITLHYRPDPIPTQPPDASLITIGPLDADGFVDVIGAPGAIPPLAAVMVANLNAGTMDVTASDASGSFSARLFAPPGSSVLVKYDIFGDTLTTHWGYANTVGTDVLGRAIGVADFGNNGYLPLLPGTMIYAGANSPKSGSEQDFAGVGAIISSNPRGWAGLWLTGTVQTDPTGFPGTAVLPGETVTVSANLRLSSPDITCTPPLTFTMDASLSIHRKFSGDGRANPDNEDFRAYMFTPTGLPINHPSSGESIQVMGVTFDNWNCVSSHSFESNRVLTYTLPVSLTEGIYVPQIWWSGSDLPLSSELPLFKPWYHMPEVIFLPPIPVGEPAQPRLPMVLFPDYPSNGQRGLQAFEDRGKFQMINWVTYPSTQLVLPRVDERTGELLTYSLEPASNWLAVTDRRVPNPLHFPLKFPSGQLTVQVHKPGGGVDTLGPAAILQSSVRTPSTPGGNQIGLRSGTLGDVYQLRTMDESFAYQFDEYGSHIIQVTGEIDDIYGNTYLIQGSYEVMIARVLDLDPAQLPTTPYSIGDVFAVGTHVYPPVPAQIQMQIVHMPYSDPTQAITHTVSGFANRFGYFQAPTGTEIRFGEPGEFRVDVSAVYEDPMGDLWAGYSSWGNVVEGASPNIAAHGRRGMDYTSEVISDMPAWFLASNLADEKKGIEAYYPYWSGDIHWGGPLPLDSIQPCISIQDLTGPSEEEIYNLLRAYVDNSVSEFRNPPDRDPTLANLNKRIQVDEAPLFIATEEKKDPSLYPEAVQMLGYWYGTSERPGVHVREVVSVDMLGVGYWGFDDNYTYQIGVPADGDQPGDMKWEFGGAVLRVPSAIPPVKEYAIYSSLWVLIPDDDPLGGRIAPPFQDATGASVDGGPIMELLGEEIDMLFLPLGVRPGDILQLGDTISFSGHVGPPLDSRVAVTVTSPSNVQHIGDWHANKIGWLYDPTFDFEANEVGRWTVEVFVEHDRPYIGNGVTPLSHNTGTVLGTQGSYEFYVVDPGSPELHISTPDPGFINWPDYQIEPVTITGRAPVGTSAIHYTIHDKGIVMDQGVLTPSFDGAFSLIYDAEALHQDFPMLSLTAREGIWEGLADEVTIHFLAVGGEQSLAASVTLIGEEVFVISGEEPVYNLIYLPLVQR